MGDTPSKALRKEKEVRERLRGEQSRAGEDVVTLWGDPLQHRKVTGRGAIFLFYRGQRLWAVA
jgi:hypothetical protein